MNTDEIDLDSSGLIWNKPDFFLDGEIFLPNVYNISNTPDTSIPSTYNTVLITLNGRLSSDLSWKEHSVLARKYVSQGLQLFWNLELGLFNELPHIITSQSQQLSLLLSLEHFRDTLYKEFKQHTMGVCIYSGPANFHREIQWDEKLQENFLEWGHNSVGVDFDPQNVWQRMLFSRDAAADYLVHFANRMPDAMQIFIDLWLDATTTLAQDLELTHCERYDRIHLNIRDSKIPKTINNDNVKVGVCLPHYSLVRPDLYSEIEDLLKVCMANNVGFRLIPEAKLISEWEGLDIIVTSPSATTPQGSRQLKGFLAAGGKVVNISDFIASVCTFTSDRI